MNITKATKNITETFTGYGVIVAINGENERWVASFEEDEQHNILTDAPIKVLHQVGEDKEVWKSYKEYNLTNELIKVLDFVIQMFDTAPTETKRVLL